METVVFTATADERKALLEAMPFINDIKDARLKDQVVEVWARVWRESVHRDLQACPNAIGALGGTDENLMQHVNRSAKIISGLAKAFEEAYATKINWDVLLADIALHDVDKLVMVDMKDGKMVKSATWECIAHGNYGAMVSYSVGVPREIVTAVHTHSPSMPGDPLTIEALLLCMGDLTTFRGNRLIHGLPISPKK